jgi:predicted DNA-binding protein
MLRHKRYGITVEPTVGRRVREYSHKTGKKMYAVVAEAIKEYLDRVDPQKETLGAKD